MSHNANDGDAGDARPENLQLGIDSSNDKTFDQKTRSNEVKVVEARAAVLLLNYSRISTKNEYTQWLLKSLFQPLTTQENDVMRVLYISRARKAVWKAEDTLWPDSTGDLSLDSDEVFALTPRTKLLTMAYEYRVVYILDLSSSLATVGSTTPTILLSGAFESLRNSLEGLVQPFSLPVSAKEKAILRPRIRLTVMADCSQFASNINLIPMLSEHPTMRVFVQNITVNANNICSVIAKLYSDFLAFQKDTASFRNLISRKRSTMEYDLDVGEGEIEIPQAVSVLDATSLPPLNSPLVLPQQKQQTTETTGDRHSPRDIRKRDGTPNQTVKREVWGIGKSGGNLSRILHAGHFALKLLPREGRPQLILITDGSMKSNMHDNAFIRQFAEEDITCHIIQVGSAQSFIPGRNFGFVPDNELLTFVTRATGGSFTYSDQCKPVVDGLDQGATVFNKDTQSTATPQPVAIILSATETDIQPPNAYHLKFLLHETSLTSRHSDLRLQEAHERTNISRDRLAMDEQQVRYNFPWDPGAKPPPEALRLLRYREYMLPAEFSHVIASRAREGFVLHSVSFDNTKKTEAIALRTFDAPDFSSVKKERIQIIMALHWQPNVVIEYRIRATWLPTIIGPLKELKTDPCFLPSSIFSRAKAPRAEVFVRTDAEFAHMLQNWDAFRRRAQMMGVVTGSSFISDTYNAPAYAKAEKLKSYLVDIYEGDEVLKAMLGFNSKYLSGLQLSGVSQQRNVFIDTFHDFWEQINNSDKRPRTRSWYDDSCIDLLLGDVSPYMSPKLASLYNQDFVTNVDFVINEALEDTRYVLSSWADFQGSDGTFVRVMNRFSANQERSEEEVKDLFSFSLNYPPSFCEMRVRHVYGRLVSVRLLFFNMDMHARHRAIEHLLQVLKIPNESCTAICQRPFSRLLMRDTKHFQVQDISIQKSRSRAWFLPPTLWLISEYIVRDYLRHTTWSWQTDSHQDRYHKENKMMPIHDLAFQFLCQARLDQGFHLVSPRPDSTHFYQEIYLPGCTDSCAIQYFIWKDPGTGKITTELWMEPTSGSYDQYEVVKAWTVGPDRKTISQLVTFDQIHAVARSKSKGDIKEKAQREPSSNQEDETMVMMLPQLFDVTSVLRSNVFVLASFASPLFQALPPHSSNGNGDLQQDSVDHPSEPIFNDQQQKDMCLRPDPILNKNKKTLIGLPLVSQSYALLHYFVENALETLADGEIIMTHHDSSTRFWSDLKQAVLSILATSAVQLVTDFRKMRCFVTLFDVRSFVVTLLPSLEAIVTGLSDNPVDDTVNHRIDFLMFECVRQKPLKPVKRNHDPRAEDDSCGASKLVIDEDDDEVVIRPIDWLVYPDDGLGETLRPRLLEGHYHGKHTSKLTERTLRVAQDVKQLYCKSFFRSFYTCLMRGLQVDAQDLEQVLDVCDESIMEINITEFVNVMALHRPGPTENDSHLRIPEIQVRFASIFRHSFEPVPTTNGEEANLFYYKPPFIRTVEQGVSADSQISRLVDLVACSQTPLLIRLECVYTDSSKGTTVRIPTTELPTTFNGYTTENKYYDFKPGTSESNTWSPFDTQSTKVSLHIVCVNMPRSRDEKYITTDPSFPFPRESLINSMRSQPSCFSTLTRDQQGALAETEARIRWLLTEETLHGLLKTATITKPILQYVDRQLGRGSLFVDFPTVINIPFQFVKDLHDSREVFMNELEKVGKVAGSYLLQRVDDYFYVSQDSVYNMREEESLCQPDEGILPNESISGFSVPPTTVADDDLCNGLGISTMNEDNDATSTDPLTVPFQDRPLYWLVLRPHERYVSIFFYSKLHIRSDVLQRVKDKLSEVQERTNRLMLLESLQETRSCSKFLEPRVENTAVMESSDEDSSEDDDNMYTVSGSDGSLVATGKFKPGQFACPVIYTKRFPLHWRLQSNVALKYLTADVLRLFVVRNRPNMYVIERDNSIVYCKIFEQDVGDTVIASTPVPASLSPQPMSATFESSLKSPEDSKGAKNTTGSTAGSDSARELVLEVHGIDLPLWIEQEFIDLIENRLTTEITLNEVQHFFLRNPNSKPTPADVKFILPLDKSPTGKEVLCVPTMVMDPSTLLLFFKQSILADTIRQFSGPYVTEAVKEYNLARFPQPSATEIAENGQFCLYYNCTRRVPGTSSPLELAVGQGLAGICITSELDRRTSGNLGGSEHILDIDPERIKNCLEAQFREPCTAIQDGTMICRVWIEVWVTGSVDSDALLHHLYECYRQSLCDYLIEKTVSIDYGAALLHRALLYDDRSTRASKAIRKKFIDSILYIMEKAAEWKSPTVYSFDQAIKIMPWSMDDIVDHVNCELCNLDTNLKMTVAWTLLNQKSSNWELYQGQKLLQHRIRNNIRLVGISGLSEFVDKLGSMEDHRRASAASDERSTATRSRRSSITSHGSESKKYRTTDEGSKAAEDRSRSSSTSRSVSGLVSRASRSSVPRVDVSKHCFLFMRVDPAGIAVYTYNWSEKASLNVFDSIFRAVTRQEARHNVLLNILQQKMGAFHHSAPLKQTVENYASLAAVPSLQHVTNQHLTPHIRISSPKQPPKQQYTQKNDSLSKLDTSTIRSTKKCNALNELQDMITHATVIDRSETTSIAPTVTTKSTDFDDRVSAQPSLSGDMKELDMTLTEFTAVEDYARQDHDILKRHGLPFLDTVIRRSAVQTIHRKARQVYRRWSRQYFIDDTNSSDKLLTRRDVRAILRSSRLMHYCRTPLLFSRVDETWDSLDEDLSSRELTSQWYMNLMDAFISDYAKYLEGVDMHLIDLAPSDDSETDTSTFHISRNFSIELPSVYLLRVVKGGSILCEVRLTGIYLSVTLYTLHRRYGRQSVKGDRESFRRFEETSGLFKQFIHVNSFVYDFHLRFIQRMLLDSSIMLPNLNIFSILTQFSTIHHRPAAYARNRLLHGFYQISSDVVVDRQKFFDNLLGNAPRYGLSSLWTKHKAVGAAVTSNDLSFSPEGGRAGQWRHSLVVFPVQANDEKEGLWLEYYILVVYQGNISPITMFKNVRPLPKANEILHDSIDNMLLLEGYTLDDIVTNACMRLDTIVADVSARRIRYYAEVPHGS
ncbi:hypothetical protein BJV82DRAFT_70230 [Fennellomyces sp. T-0311]|nr:hypothetical protein BJV82DRAFT_70230 [Fennellomyces sp. T-0311]